MRAGINFELNLFFPPRTRSPEPQRIFQLTENSMKCCFKSGGLYENRLDKDN